MVKIILYLALLVPIGLSSQVDENLKIIIERYLENSESSSDFTQIVDELSGFESRPLNVNNASNQQLLTFPFFDPSDVARIIKHRERFGLFLDIAELQVLGISPDVITFISPYLTVKESEIQSFKKLVKLWNKGNGEVSLTSGIKTPFISQEVAGDKWSQQVRMRYKLPGLFSLSLNVDKDPGEVLYRKSGPYKGLEFLSGHVSVHNIGHINDLVLGDFVLQVGEGLVMGSGIGIGKSANVMSIKRGGSYIRPYRGINEFLFHRGAASSVSFGKFKLNLAYAINQLDAAISRDTLVSDESFTSVDLDGLHRTETELKKKGQLQRNLMHGGLSYNGKKGVIGASYTGFRYSSDLSKSAKLYAFHRPIGRSLDYVNIYQNHVIGNVLLFSEWAYSPTNNSYALAAGMLTSIAPKVDLGLHYRDASNGYLSPNSTAFAATSNPEQGLYFSTKINFSKKYKLSVYKDIFKNKWLSFGKSDLYISDDLLVQLDISPNKKTQFYLRGRSYEKFTDNKDGEIVQLETINVQQVRIHFQSDLTKMFKFETRGEWNQSNYSNRKNNASLVYLDFKQKLRKGNQSLAARYSVYNIPDFNARIFAFEDQLQYLFSIAGYYGRGQAFYVVYSTKPTRKLKLSARYGINQSVNPDNEISRRTSVFLQCLYRI